MQEYGKSQPGSPTGHRDKLKPLLPGNKWINPEEIPNPSSSHRDTRDWETTSKPPSLTIINPRA